VHETTVRFTDELWTRVRLISQREGISAAQFVRDATVARIAVEEHLRALRIELDALLRALDQRVQELEQALQRHGLR
jgi:predicted DNA-binding protein